MPEVKVFRDRKDIYPNRCDYYLCQRMFKKDSVPYVHWHLGFKTYWCNLTHSRAADTLRGS